MFDKRCHLRKVVLLQSLGFLKFFVVVTFQPLVVLMMLTFLAQWRFLGCYTLANTEVLVLNGTAVAASFLFFWYTLWGVIQKTRCMGVCINKIKSFITYNVWISV